MVGQSSKIPDVGRLEQSLDPPPQLGIPEDPTREAPIMSMTVPITQVPRSAVDPLLTT